MKVIGYARVSTTNQDLERQRMNIEKYCSEKQYELLQIIEDFGISGASNEREGYKQVTRLSSTDCDLLVVSELSRLSRQEEITATLNDIQRVLSAGISIVLLDQRDKVYEGGSVLPLQDLIILVVGLWGAAKERLDIKKKMLDGKAALFLSNPYACVDGRVPFGFRKISNPASNRPRYILEENPDEVAQIQKVFELVTSGYTLRQTAGYFNDRNIYFRGCFVVVSLLSDIIKNELYKGIRKRERKSMIESETTYTAQIKPIIDPAQWELANRMVKENTTYVSSGKKYYNPLKGIFRCKCGRAMVVKSKQSEAGHTKLTYRCSCTESKQSPKWCTSNIDEVSYNLTNQIIEAIFQQKQTDITDYFKKVGDSKIIELKQIRNGLDGRIQSHQQTLIQIAKQKEGIGRKFLITEQEDLLRLLQNQMTGISKREQAINNEIKELSVRIAGLDKQIAEIEAMPAKARSQFDLSREEISDIFHQNLTQITYYPFSLMKGVYKIEYKNGATLYAIVTKVRTGAKAFLLTNSTIDLGTGDITLRWEEYEVDEPDGTGTKFSFPRAIQREKKVNILDKGLFESEELEIATLRLAIDSDFRKDYYLKSKDEVLAEAKMDE